MAELDKLSGRTAKYFDQNKIEASKADQAQMDAYENSYNDGVEKLYDETEEFKKNLVIQEQAKKDARAKAAAEVKGAITETANSVASKPSAPISSGDFKSNYNEVLKNTSPNYAQIWTMRWEADHFDPSRMPPIPSAEDFRGAKGGTSATPPPLPTSTLSDAEMQKSSGAGTTAAAGRVTPPPAPNPTTSTEELVKAIVDAIRELADDITPDDQNIHVSVDRTGMEFGIKAVIDKLHARGGV